MKRSKSGVFFQRAAHALLLRPFLKVFCGVNVIGRRNLRGLERFILIANHNSHFDVMLMFHSLPLRVVPNTHPVADGPYFGRSTLVKRLVEFLFAPVWISRERDKRDSNPLDDISACLDAGGNIVIFPEGTRGEPGQMRAFKHGIGRLSVDRPGVPVVPVFLSGPERALPKQSSLPVPFWQHVVVGPPQLPSGSSQDITAALERAVEELSQSDAVRRQTRQPRREGRAPTVVVLGTDGSGKSTQAGLVARLLSRGGSAAALRDELTFYEDTEARRLQPLVSEAIRSTISKRAKKAGSLRSYKIPKLADLFLRDHLLGEVDRWYRPGVIITDGSPLLNIVAWSALYKPERFNAEACTQIIDVLTGGEAQGDEIFTDFPELRQLRRLRLTHLKRPDVVVFLDVDPTTAIDRITSRAERVQVHETKDKLASLRSAYLQVCDVVEQKWGVPTLRVDGSRPVDAIAGEIVNFCRAALAHKDAKHESH